MFYKLSQTIAANRHESPLRGDSLLVLPRHIILELLLETLPQVPVLKLIQNEKLKTLFASAGGSEIPATQ